MKTPLISIIIPVYNAGPYLNESVGSILGQTHTNFELIVIDDGSTDQSIGIVENYKDKRIKIVRNNHNFIKSLNLGFRHAKGKYIARMDADDIMLANRLKTQYHFIEDHPDIAICGSWAEAFGTRNYIMQTPVSHHEIISNLLLNNILMHPTVIMRKSALCKYPKYPNLYKQKYLYAEDYKLWTELACKGYRFANIPEVLLKYRASDTQVTSVHSTKMINISHIIQMQYFQKVAEIIVKADHDYCDFFNDAIKLINDNKLSINNFKLSVVDIYRQILTQGTYSGF